MASLILIGNDGSEREFPLTGGEVVIGRHLDAGLRINAIEVSRRHCRVWKEGERFFLEDLGSSNGTFLNGKRVRDRAELHPRDLIRIGPYSLRFGSAHAEREEVTICGQAQAATTNETIFRENAAQKLRAVLDISHILASAADLDDVFRRLLDQLLVLFPKADHVAVVLAEAGVLVLRGSKARTPGTRAGGFSQSVVQHAITAGSAVLAQDTHLDERFKEAVTLMNLGIRSFVCAPMALRDGTVLGAIQLDRTGAGHPFNTEDLNLLAALSLQVSAVVQNRRLQEQVLAQERISRELAVARQIQESFLPPSLPAGTSPGVELFARVIPAQQVSGDFYDYFTDDQGRLTFAIADVCGKGMPAALFMTMCLTHLRNLGPGIRGAADTLLRLNDALTRSNTGNLFVTMALGKWDPNRKTATVTYGGHPFGLLRAQNGLVQPLGQGTGSLLGWGPMPTPAAEVEAPLHPGEALFFYTDGVTEAQGGPAGGRMFGTDRLAEVVSGLPAGEPVQEWARRIHLAVNAFAEGRPLGDDLTLLILRRND